MVHQIDVLLTEGWAPTKLARIAGMPLEDWRVFPYKVLGLPEDGNLGFGTTRTTDGLMEQLQQNPDFVIDRSNPVPMAHGPTIYL